MCRATVENAKAALLGESQIFAPLVEVTLPMTYLLLLLLLLLLLFLYNRIKVLHIILVSLKESSRHKSWAQPNFKTFKINFINFINLINF